jgi:hypothetical protein
MKPRRPGSSLYVFYRQREATLRQRTQNTFQLCRVAALKGTFAAKGGALQAGERGSIDMMVVWDATVHWLTCHLLVPFALCAGHCDAGSHLKETAMVRDEKVGPRYGKIPFSPGDSSESCPGTRRTIPNI